MTPRSDSKAVDRSPSRLRRWVAPACHEDVFVQRYAWLRGWALRLSGGDPLEADDLLHNAFLQFVLRRRELSEIESLDGYLYGLLRRLRLSHARKALRRRQEPLLAVDYDSAEMCVPGADVRELLQVEAELHAVCEYACLRKESSKAGSVLILRFFHGYYPKEIAAILKSSLRLANDWLRIARNEARTYLENPSRLSFLSRINRPQPSPSAQHHAETGHTASRPGSDGSADVLGQLRERIRQARIGTCLTAVDVEGLYSGPSEDSVSCSTLSHIVCCPECLDLVTRHLDLGSYSDRDPRDMLGPDGGWRAGQGAAGGNGHRAMLRTGARRLRALLEHRPTELLIAANGLPLGTLKVRSVDSQLELAANLDEPIDFIEIFSEQGVRLLLFEVEAAPRGDVEQGERVAFDEGRWLQLKVEFTRAWPTVHLDYHDPLVVPTTGGRVLDEAPISVAAAEPEAPTHVTSHVPRWRERLSSAWRAPLVRPAFAVVVLLGAAALWAALPWRGGVASASELLRTARASEQVLLAPPDVAVHRVLLLEERRPPERTVLSRRRIDVWQNGGSGVAVRRLYNEQNHLTAGEWTRMDGSRTVYRPGAAPKLLPRDETVQPIDPEVIWRWEPSAGHFAELVGATVSPTVENRGSDYLLRYRNQSDGAKGVVEATLTIRKTEMRAVAHTLVVRTDELLREYAFTETALASMPASTVPAATFEPEAELLGRVVPLDAPAVVPSAVPVSTTAVLSEDEGNRLEIEALFALHRLEPCLAEPGEISRAFDGLRARAAVVDAACRDRVSVRLAGLGPPTAIKIEVAVASAPLASAVRSGESLSELPPGYRLLADRFSASVDSASTPAEVADAARGFGAWAVTSSSRALGEARELERLVAAWPPRRLAALDVDRTTMWLDVVRDHARRFRRESEQVRAQLESLFAIDSARAPATGEGPPFEIHRSGDVPGAVARLVSMAASHDTAIRQLFDTALRAPRVPVDVSALAGLLRAAEQQAALFDEPWTIEP